MAITVTRSAMIAVSAPFREMERVEAGKPVIHILASAFVEISDQPTRSIN
jgi:hypothetical protein